MSRFTVTVTFVSGMLVTSTAFGLAQRTFVSTTGSDSAPCSLAAPCRSFAAALAQTASGGEIIVLDSGGYGAVGISKDVSIIAPKGVYAGISVFSTSPSATGVTIFDAAVSLRGLSINGQGGDTGIHVFGNSVAHIEDCVISNLDQYGVRAGGLLGTPQVFIGQSTIRDNASHGIYATATARVRVDRTSIQRNGDHGILALNGPTVTVTSSAIDANGVHGVAAIADDDASQTTMSVTETTVARNLETGVYAATQGGTAYVALGVARNTVSRNGEGGIVADASSGGTIVAAISDNVVTYNHWGIDATGANAYVIAGKNVVTGNTHTGLRQSNSATFLTRGNNTAQFNIDDISGTLFPVAGD